MRGSPGSMVLLRPASAAEAVKAYAKNPKATPLAGGTDFMVLWNFGILNDRTVLDLSKVREWTKIKKSAKALSVGSLVTHMQLQDSAEVRAAFPLLVQACSQVGGVQIQNRGTLGGNIANASPAGDTFPALSVYEAVVVAVSPKGRRRIPFSEVFAGVKKTTLGPSELIESIELPVLKAKPSRRLFVKVGTRAAQAISKTVAAGLLWLNKDGTVRELRFAFGSMAPTVRRLSAAEDYLEGRKLDGAAIAHACALVAEDLSPIDDIRSTAEYRLKVSSNLLRSFLEGRHG